MTETEALAEAKRIGKKVEVVSLRGESSEVFATPEGELEAREYLRPVWTRIDGQWQAVDTTLAKADGMVAPKAASADVAFSGGGQGPLVRLQRAGRMLELTWPGTVPTPALDGDTATYTEILPGVDLRLAVKPEGFTQLLVVKSAEAAKSSELAELRLKLAAHGMTVRETPEGGLEAVDEGAGGAVFEASTPLMWDSSAGDGAATAEAAKSSAAGVASGSGEPVEPRVSAEPGEPGAAESGQLAPVGVEVSEGGGELVLTPDREVLAGADTVYPVFIDPQFYAPRTTAWTMVSKYWAGSPQWKFNGESNAGLGYCGWAYCKPNDTKRLFYRIPTSRFAGKTILSAEFVVRETHAASCQAREVQLWRTKGINSSTTWNTQTAAGFWVDHIQNRSFAHGYDGCAAADAEFNVKGVVAQAAAKKWSTITFGMRATNETDRYTWKRFSDAAFLRVKYNRPPAQIKVSQLTQDPGGACGKPGAPKYVRSLPKLRASGVTDPDKDRVRVQFRASWDAGDGKGFTARWTSAASTDKASGSDFSISLPTSIAKNKLITWSARANDSAQWSPWSWVGSAHACGMVYDTSVPAGPSITSAQYPPSDSEDPNDPWRDGVGRYGTFTIDSTSADVRKYWFGINGDPTSKHTLTTSGGGARTTKFMPTRPGVNFITAQAFDVAGNGSEIRTYQFRVRVGQPDRLTWDLDEGAGASAVKGQGGTWPAELFGGAQPGAEGVTGRGLHLDGVDDHAATLSPVLNTGKSFSVSLWARLPADKPNAATVAISQGGRHTSGFEIYHSTALGGWVFLRHSSDTATGSSTVRAVQPPCPTGDTACQSGRLGAWTHLAGVFDSTNSQMSLYVDGRMVGKAAFSGAWDARGRTVLGAASHYGTLGSFFPGDLDEVQLFDYQLTGNQVTRLHAKQPVDTNRPAKLVWPLDEEATATEVTGRAQQVAAELKGGAKTGADGVAGKGLELDGVDDHVTTNRPIMDTFQSFAVAAWVRLPKDKEDRAMTAVAQSGVTQRGFGLYHSSGGWVFMRPTADSTDTSFVRARQNACPAGTSGCPTAGLGEWNHAVGVYDSDAAQIRLYVNGKLVDTKPFTSRWLATGPVTLGAATASTGEISRLRGNLDDVRLYDRTISDDEVQQLFRQRPVVKARWKFEDAPGTPPVTPDASASGNGMALHGNPQVGSGLVDGGVVLNGVDEYGVTSAVPMDTSASYTVSAWVQTAAVPDSPVTVLSAPGSTRSAFTVRYEPSATPGADPGRWRITVEGADSTGGKVTQVDNGQFFGPTEWTHLTLVYDGFADRLSLYVNGELETFACTDTDGDGDADDTTCADRVSWADNALSYKATQPMQLGRVKTGANTGAEYWPGAVSDLWVFQGTLTELQIQYLARGWPGLPTDVPGE
ncbi:LamG-like jellyroll fold domain-containing protein [Streptomyces sp. NPDC002845]